MQPVGLYRLGGRGLMVIDNRLRILTARAPGEPWTDHQEVMVATPRNDVSVASDDAGAYVSLGNEGYPRALYRLDAEGLAPTPVPAPEAEPGDSIEGRYFMVARSAGLFVFYGTPTFLFRSQSGSWEHRTLPGKACKGLKLDDEGREVAVECGGKSYRSLDGGATWSRPET